MRGVVERENAWLAAERARGTLIPEELLWREAHRLYREMAPPVPEESRSSLWATIASQVVFASESAAGSGNERDAIREACRYLAENPGAPFAERARTVATVGDRCQVDPWRLSSLLQPGCSYPWMFHRALWSAPVVTRGLAAILAPFDWREGEEPDEAWVAEHGIGRAVPAFLASLELHARPEGPLGRFLGATRRCIEETNREGRDFATVEPYAFIAALEHHGLSRAEVGQAHRQLLALRAAAALLESFHLYHRAEHAVRGAERLVDADPEAAYQHLATASNLYKRLAIAQLYPELVLARHQQINRRMADLRSERGLPDRGRDHVLLVSTCNSPGDLRRLLVSIAHELMSFGCDGTVHVIVSDESTPDNRALNQAIIAQAVRAGLSVSHWDLDRRREFLKQVSDEMAAGGRRLDVHGLAGALTPDEKGVPYGRMRNFLRLAALHEVRSGVAHDPIFTWLDQDNELGALVLTRAGCLAERHVFNYFEQKNRLFEEVPLLVAGGGYTNDALEGVERFWVAWGVLHNSLHLAQNHSPDEHAKLPQDVDITRFRPWHQPETLERLPREGERVERISDQFLLLLNTLLGTFRGKYDNQVQIYHPWTSGHIDPGTERLAEDVRPFAGMPGGNTSFTEPVLRSPIPFVTAGGRGEDILHLWLLEGRHGWGTSCLTHTPTIHTRNIRQGRRDLMLEIIDSYNGRLFREPPYVWWALAHLPGSEEPKDSESDVESQTLERIHALHAEAKAKMDAVGRFAEELEPHVDDSRPHWWIERARVDPAYAQVIGDLRETARRFKNVGAYHRLADEKLLGLDEIKELTARFVAAHAQWEAVVEHVGGRRHRVSVAETGHALQPPAGGARESYGSPLRQPVSAEAVTGSRPASLVDLPVVEETEGEPQWQEVVTSSTLLYRHYERACAERDAWPEWSERVQHLREIFEHYRAPAGRLPSSVWTRLYRDAFFVPTSRPYRAVTALLEDGAARKDRRSTRSGLRAVSARFGVDEALLGFALRADGDSAAIRRPRHRSARHRPRPGAAAPVSS